MPLSGTSRSVADDFDGWRGGWNERDESAWDHLRLTREEFDARTSELLTEEAKEAFARADTGETGFQLWWLSFVDPSRWQEPSQNPGFLGVAIVEALGFMDAVLQAKANGCNPGGQVSGWPVFHEIPPEYRNRLLTAAEAQEVRG
jgi:hypothetical protein